MPPNVIITPCLSKKLRFGSVEVRFVGFSVGLGVGWLRNGEISSEDAGAYAEMASRFAPLFLNGGASTICSSDIIIYNYIINNHFHLHLHIYFRTRRINIHLILFRNSCS